MKLELSLTTDRNYHISPIFSSALPGTSVQCR